MVSNGHWDLLKYYPAVIPLQGLFDDWQRSHWPEYHTWLTKHSITNVEQWQTSHHQARLKPSSPTISIITPVHNTAHEILVQCILSVRLQTSPYWELLLVDDGSSNRETGQVLKSSMCHDPRIKILASSQAAPQGISAATNRGIRHASGDFIAFLDHDDRLAPEAIQLIRKELQNTPDLDIVYSDRDMISPNNERTMHLMKPSWSPETLYSGNYIFHLMCYRKKLVAKVGFLRSEYDGSQDYDLILRCMEHTERIAHIPKILYHWRQHDQSVSMNEESKSYAFNAGIKALENALQRRGIKATVSEHESLWRGNYQIHLTPASDHDISKILLPEQSAPKQYNQFISAKISSSKKQQHLFIHSKAYSEIKTGTTNIIASWLEMDKIGMVSGCLIDQDKHFLYAGMAFNSEGNFIRPYSGYPFTEPGYMAVTKITRNISLPNPFSVAIRREIWEDLNGFDPAFDGPLALLDLALRANQTGWRIIYLPIAVFTSTIGWEINCSSKEGQHFKTKWKDWFEAGDHYYSRNISPGSINYQLDSK